MTEIECVAHTEDVLGEVPVKYPREQALYWIDAFKPAVHRHQPETGAITSVRAPAEGRRNGGKSASPSGYFSHYRKLTWGANVSAQQGYCHLIRRAGGVRRQDIFPPARIGGTAVGKLKMSA